MPNARVLSALAAFVALCLAWTASTVAMDVVSFRHDGRVIEVVGRVEVEAQDGGLLVLGRDGVLWTVEPDKLIEHTKDDRPFEPLSRDELAKQVLAKLPQGFKVHNTTHYMICYDTSAAYAQWCGSLFERLYLAFTNFWTRRGFELKKPEFPLVAVVFADRESYLKYSRPELGEAGESIIGYFSLLTNRMTMYDLTGVEARGTAGRVRTAAQINQVLSQPDAMRTVATIVHEATHQIAFNCGLHRRLSDCPLWFSEGIAVYFETPDLSSARGWNGIGAINQPRLERFQKYVGSRPTDSLYTLIADDRRFRDPKQGPDAYAEAWALTYFLLKQRPKQYVAYLAALAEKGPLVNDEPKERLEEFRKAFGEMAPLETEFLRYMSRLR